MRANLQKLLDNFRNEREKHFCKEDLTFRIKKQRKKAWIRGGGDGATGWIVFCVGKG